MLTLALNPSGLFLVTRFGVRCSAVGPRVELEASENVWVVGRIAWSGLPSDPVYFIATETAQTPRRLKPNSSSNPALRYPPTSVYRLGRPLHKLSAFRGYRP